jgi:hypothetical protein
VVAAQGFEPAVLLDEFELLLGVEERWLASLNDPSVAAKLGDLSSRRGGLTARIRVVVPRPSEKKP